MNVWCRRHINCAKIPVSAPRQWLLRSSPNQWWGVWMQTFFHGLWDLKAPPMSTQDAKQTSNCCNLLAPSLLKIAGRLTSKGTLWGEHLQGEDSKATWNVCVKRPDAHALGRSVTGKQERKWAPQPAVMLGSAPRRPSPQCSGPLPRGQVAQTTLTFRIRTEVWANPHF